MVENDVLRRRNLVGEVVNDPHIESLEPSDRICMKLNIFATNALM